MNAKAYADKVTRLPESECDVVIIVIQMSNLYM